MSDHQLTIWPGTAVADGPSREDLFDALRLRNEQRLVVFGLVIEGQVERLTTLVNGVTAEDGSGHSWLLKLSFKNRQAGRRTVINTAPVYLYYHDKRRNGTVVDHK